MDIFWGWARTTAGVMACVGVLTAGLGTRSAAAAAPQPAHRKLQIVRKFEAD
jgi:hypothetical protein